MNRLTLDTASKTGWCYGTIDKRGVETITSGVWDFTPKAKESRHNRFAIIFNTVRKFIQTHPVDLAIFERKFGSFNDSLVLQAKIDGIIQAVLAWHMIEMRNFTATEIKKFATGSGKADKAAMIEACRTRTGINPKDDNEADAVCIYLMAKDRITDFIKPVHQVFETDCVKCNGSHKLKFKKMGVPVVINRKEKDFVALCPVTLNEIYIDSKGLL